jgi:hypothetical protein
LACALRDRFVSEIDELHAPATDPVGAAGG